MKSLRRKLITGFLASVMILSNMPGMGLVVANAGNSRTVINLHVVDTNNVVVANENFTLKNSDCDETINFTTDGWGNASASLGDYYNITPGEYKLYLSSDSHYNIVGGDIVVKLEEVGSDYELAVVSVNENSYSGVIDVKLQDMNPPAEPEVKINTAALKVVDTDGKPVEDVSIALISYNQSTSGSEYHTIVSDSDGKGSYQFKSYDDGKYKLQVKLNQAYYGVTEYELLVTGGGYISTINGETVTEAKELVFVVEKVKSDPAPDKTALNAAITDADSLSSLMYTVSTWYEFNKTRAAAKVVQADAEATQDAIDAAVKNLADAKAALVSNRILNIKVVDENGNPVALADEELWIEKDSYGDDYYFAGTDGNGIISLDVQNEIVEDTYTFVLDKKGYELACETVMTIETCSSCFGKPSMIGTVNGEEYKGLVIIAVKEHVHDYITVSGKTATCTESGLTEGMKCSGCGYVVAEQKVTDALGHHEVVDAAKAPTYFATGLTKGKHCDRCGKVTVKRKTVAKLKLGQAKAPRLKAGKKYIKVSYQAVKGANAYQIRYYKKGTKSTKIITVKGSKAATKKLSKLSKKRWYNIKVRAIRTVNGRTAYGSWSAERSVKVK